MYSSTIDIDANQYIDTTTKDKSDVTYYNYSKKGYFKRDYRSLKKDS
jgi:hypothetical protein